MNAAKPLLKTGLYILGFVIVMTWCICSIGNRLLLFDIHPMANVSLLIGLLLMLLGSRKNGRTNRTASPEEIIQIGILFLCAIGSTLLAEILKPFLPIIERIAYFNFFVIFAGLMFGMVLNRVRPTYTESTGVWRKFLHFILTQLNFQTAFRRKK